MPDAEETEIINGLRSGLTRFESVLYHRYLNFIYWGMKKFNLSKDDARHAYNDTVCSVIFNIVDGTYKQDPNVLLKTYALTIFHHRCVDRSDRTSKRPSPSNPEKDVLQNSPAQNLQKSTQQRSPALSQQKEYLLHPQSITGSLADKLSNKLKGPVEIIIDKEDRLKVENCLEKLGEPCKQILQLCGRGYKDKEIAHIMNYNNSDVAKQTKLRCRKRFKECYFANE